MVFLPQTICETIKEMDLCSCRHVGPNKIVHKLSDMSYEIQKSVKDKPIVVHVGKENLIIGNRSFW